MVMTVVMMAVIGMIDDRDNGDCDTGDYEDGDCDDGYDDDDVGHVVSDDDDSIGDDDHEW